MMVFIKIVPVKEQGHVKEVAKVRFSCDGR